MKKISTLKRIALALVIIGAINWGLIGLFRFDLVAAIFGGQAAALSRIVYALVGLSGLYCITMLFRPMQDTSQGRSYQNLPGNLNYNTEFAEETKSLSEEEQNKSR